MRDTIIPVSIEAQMKSAYIDYSMSVNAARALPDVRDGLKPVHRRILFAMHGLGIRASGGYKKSARIVGEVLGKYHPHGDTAVYDAMVRMGQPWSMRACVIDGQGNYGSPDGDGPAAMRYTEAKLTRLAESMLEDIQKDTVDFQKNFDDSLDEPTVLPTRIPQLLVNGSTGIGVGMATSMMPHNLGEVIDGCIAYIDNREIEVEELMRHIKAPDFPTGGIIYGLDGVVQAMKTGRGRVVLRGRVEIEDEQTNSPRIVITEVPYQVSRDELAEKIGELVNQKDKDKEKPLQGISDISNQSNKEGTRIVVELKRDAVPNVIINQLYKHTNLQVSFGINNVVVKNGRPCQLNLKELIEAFVGFRHEIVVRRTKYELREAQKRMHILLGYLICLDRLDEVITAIRASATPDIAHATLQKDFGLSEIQAKAVLEMRLQRLTGLERDKIQQEHDQVKEAIANYEKLLADEGLRYEVIKDELREIKDKYATPRLSTIEPVAGKSDMRDFIPDEDVVITISHGGYIKRTAATEYRQQKRGGRGALGSTTREEDWIEHLFIASTHHTLLFFTEQGRCHWLNVYDIPESAKTSKGRAIQNVLQLAAEDKVRAVIDVKDLQDKAFVKGHAIILCTQKGMVKKTALTDFSRPRQGGIIAINIMEGDVLLEARLTDLNADVMLALRCGNVIRFHESKVRETGRGATGVRGMEVRGDDAVIGMITVAAENCDTQQVLVVSENGYGKQTLLSEYRVTNRGGKGVRSINVTEKTGELVGILDVGEQDDLMITCKSGVTIRTAVATIRKTGRVSQGVRLISLTEGDSIAAIAKITRDSCEEEVVDGEEGTQESDK